MPLVDLGKKLLEAAKLGQIENVEVLLLNGALFTTDWLGNTALHYAAQNGHVEMCQLLIRAGVNYDARTKVNRTPLHIATQEGHLAVVQLLISSGADIHSTDMIGMTALHWAVQKGYFDVVHLLMQHGANASLPNKFTKTPLDIAFDVGRNDLCQLLQLSPSADVDSAPVEEVTTTNTAERDIIDDILDDNTVLCLPITLIQNSTAPLGIHQAATDGSVVTASVQNVITAVPQMSCHSVQLSSAAEDADVPPSSATSASTAVNNDDVGLTHSEDLVTLASLAEVTSTTNEHCKQMTESDTLTWLKTHGTAVDSSNLAMSTLNRGQTVVLTDAGKLVMHDVALATDITCFQHNVEVGKIDTADQIDTAASDDEDIEPLSKKSKCAKDATHQDRKLTEWQDCVTDSHKDSTCKPLLLNQELLEHS